MKTWEQIAKELKTPFHPDDIEWRVGSTTQDKSKGLALAYITNRAIQNRLDEVFGINNWRNEFKPWQNNGVLCGISIRIEGDQEWITKWDGSDESNMDATKGGLSGAMKRAGYQLGIGRYLYNLDSSWVELKPAGKGHVIKPGCEPSLPQWALPEGFTYKGTNKKVDTQPKETQSQAIQQPQGVEHPNVLPFGKAGKQGSTTVLCGVCKAHIGPGVVNYCKQNNIEPPTCMVCRKVPQQQKEGN